jgi:hypothetical protein
LLYAQLVPGCRLRSAQLGMMTVTALTNREFNQGAGDAKKAARRGRVLITDPGRPMSC